MLFCVCIEPCLLALPSSNFITEALVLHALHASHILLESRRDVIKILEAAFSGKLHLFPAAISYARVVYVSIDSEFLVISSALCLQTETMSNKTTAQNQPSQSALPSSIS